MRFDEYRRHDATALAGLIAKGEVSAKEVLETAIARAEQVNPAINAIVHKQYDQARRAVAAGPAERPAQGRALSHQGPRLLREGRAGHASAAACLPISSPITTAPTCGAARRPASSSWAAARARSSA